MAACTYLVAIERERESLVTALHRIHARLWFYALIFEGIDPSQIKGANLFISSAPLDAPLL